MAMEVCSNCGEPMTLTRTECDYCGWVPANKVALEAKKKRLREFVREITIRQGDEPERYIG